MILSRTSSLNGGPLPDLLLERLVAYSGRRVGAILELPQILGADHGRRQCPPSSHQNKGTPTIMVLHRKP